jgi:heat shock protein HtpX
MWEQIRANRIRSGFIIVFMGALLVFVGFALGLYFLGSAEAGAGIAIVVWAIMMLVAFSQGDNILLSLGKAHKIEKQDHPRLYNIVEEMTIAAGLPKMPDIYIIDDPAPNAFATGRKPDKAAVAVTSGLLQRLNRDELQGVIAHELGHIGNRDTMLMAIGSIMLGTIVILAYYGSRVMFFSGGNRRSSSSGGGGGGAILLIVALVLMILAPIAAQLLYFALSRKREYLADASSALYTRYPEGLASALEKISGSTVQLKSANNATAPMYIVNPFRKKGLAASDLTSTHPPTSKRIQVLRSMSGASFGEYDAAFRQVAGRRGVVPQGSMAAVAAVPLRAASTEADKAADTEVKRAREVGDVLWKKNKYQTIDCQCGARLRVPPGLGAETVRCPRCGTVHRL